MSKQQTIETLLYKQREFARMEAELRVLRARVFRLEQDSGGIAVYIDELKDAILDYDLADASK